MNIELLLFLSALVNRAVEAIKRVPAFGRIPDEWRSWVLLIVSAVLGVLVVGILAPEQNLFPIPDLAPIWGVVFTGIVVGSGANSINFVVDLLNRRTPQRASVSVSTAANAPTRVIVSDVSTPDAA